MGFVRKEKRTSRTDNTRLKKASGEKTGGGNLLCAYAVVPETYHFVFLRCALLGRVQTETGRRQLETRLSAPHMERGSVLAGVGDVSTEPRTSGGV